MKLARLTSSEWTQELTTVLAVAEWPMRVVTAIVEQTTPMCYAELRDATGNDTCRVSLARDRFPTPADRQREILRQLRESAKLPAICTR